ncbi:MAG: hypothetical protein B7X02_01890, partial [Rhodospirillales bacterium 12-54-5]
MPKTLHTESNIHAGDRARARADGRGHVHVTRGARAGSFAAGLLAWSLATTALANPVGGTVSGGAGSINSSGDTLTVTQTTDRAVFDWQGFDIGANETTRFNQPNANAVALNRIHSATPSQIDGRLSANGNLVLVNPNGVVFGAGAQVDVNGLVATTSNIANSSFLAGQLTFDQPGDPNAKIENRGTITARDAGLVGLVAPNVINSGTITANLGRVQLGSGDSFTLDLYGDGLMNLAVSDAVGSQLIEHSGAINAAGGKVLITAAAGRQAVDSLIRVSGEINTPAVAEHAGVIEIFAAGSHAKGTFGGRLANGAGAASGNSTVEVYGTLNATNDHGQGGRIAVSADRVGIGSTAQIDASGTLGGGAISIGGDVHGGETPSVLSTVERETLAAVRERLGPNPTPNALYTVVQSGAIIRANATDTGHGGLVAVWADERTDFEGRIDANGGLNGGDGGLIETSGKNILMALGDANAAGGGEDRYAIDPVTNLRTRTRTRGKAGEWLLDPGTITIGTTAISGVTTSGTNPFSYTGTTSATASYVPAATINSKLAAG